LSKGTFEEFLASAWYVRPCVMRLIPLDAQASVAMTGNAWHAGVASNEEGACSAYARFLIEVESIDVHHISYVF
jgi:hypothetical protein